MAALSVQGHFWHQELEDLLVVPCDSPVKYPAPNVSTLNLTSLLTYLLVYSTENRLS